MKKPTASQTSRQILALNLQLVRTLNRTSQEGLGLMCGLKRTYIGALERGEINPGVDNLDRIAAGIGLRAHELLLEPDKAYAVIHRALIDCGGSRVAPAVPPKRNGGP